MRKKTQFFVFRNFDFSKIAEKWPSKGKKLEFRKTEKNLFSHRLKEHIFKKLGYWVENCGL